jgi:hypothetical protein
MEPSAQLSPDVRRCGGCRPLTAFLLVVIAAALCGCGSSRPRAREPAIPSALAAQARPVGAGARFHPAPRGPVLGACRRRLGAREGAHVEVFAENRVVLIPAGVGTLPPRTLLDGRVRRARCYGALVTLDPTGLVLVRPASQLHLGDLLRSWGEQLSGRGLGPFTSASGKPVAVFVDGQRWRGSADAVPLHPHAEIVLEVGPYVPPHRSYAFPPGS